MTADHIRHTIFTFILFIDIQSSEGADSGPTSGWWRSWDAEGFLQCLLDMIPRCARIGYWSYIWLRNRRVVGSRDHKLVYSEVNWSAKKEHGQTRRYILKTKTHSAHNTVILGLINMKRWPYTMLSSYNTSSARLDVHVHKDEHSSTTTSTTTNMTMTTAGFWCVNPPSWGNKTPCARAQCVRM